MLPPSAYRFLFLNGVRALSIIFLILVFASNIVTMVNDVNAVKHAGDLAAAPANGTHPIDDMIDCDYIEGSTVPNQPAGSFWAVTNRIFILIQVILLVFAEFGWPEAFFEKFLPFLGVNYGVGAIGVFECILGAAILSHHVDTFTMVSAFLLFSIGVLNIIVALIFGSSVKSKRSILSWRERVPGLPKSVKDIKSHIPSPSSVFNEKPLHPETTGDSNGSAFPGYGFGRQGSEKAALKGFLISKPVESLPRYAPKVNSTSSSRASSPPGHL